MGKGQERNKPCTCGSGKKHKVCCYGRKPLSTAITVDFGAPVAVDGFRLTGDGSVELLSEGKRVTPQRAWMSVQRERTKGEKTLVKVPVEPEALAFVEGAALLQYDIIFAVDTNTREVQNRRISIGSIFQVRFMRDAGMVIRRFLAAIELHNVTAKPENAVWKVLQFAIKLSSGYRPGLAVAILTDSDLGNHEAYNARQVPFHGETFLESGFKLVYASDEGRSLVNSTLRLCDKMSREFFTRLELRNPPIELAAATSHADWTHARAWLDSGSAEETAEWFRFVGFPLLSHELLNSTP